VTRLSQPVECWSKCRTVIISTRGSLRDVTNCDSKPTTHTNTATYCRPYTTIHSYFNEYKSIWPFYHMNFFNTVNHFSVEIEKLFTVFKKIKFVKIIASSVLRK